MLFLRKNIIKKSASIFILTAALTACSSVTIHPEASQKLASPPSHEESKGFYFWGLEGEHRVNVAEICGNNSVSQMQSQATFRDVLMSVITLGVYAPHTVKIWCEQNV